MSEPKRAFKGVWIPAKIWIRTDLSWMEKCLWAEIDSLCDKDGCFASNSHLATRMGSSLHSIGNMISKLRALGLLFDLPKPSSETRSISTEKPDEGFNPQVKGGLTQRLNPEAVPYIRELPVESTGGGDGKESALKDVQETLLKKWREKGFPKVLQWTPKRQRLLSARSKEPEFMANWEKALDRFADSEFVMNQWKPVIDCFLRPGLWAEILEGKYDNRKIVRFEKPAPREIECGEGNF